MAKASKGFGKAIKRLDGIAKRSQNAQPGLRAIGKMWVRRHVWYFRRHIGSQTGIGGGPPGDPWKGLSENTVDAKEKAGKVRKLIDRGTLWQSFVYKIRSKTVLVFNRDVQKVVHLQEGLGYTVVATAPKRQDPEYYRRTVKAFCNFIFRGKA